MISQLSDPQKELRARIRELAGQGPRWGCRTSPDRPLGKAVILHAGGMNMTYRLPCWTVLDTDGTLLGRVFFPPRFRPYHIDTDRVTGVWRDVMDVEYVRMYRLLPRESP